MDPVSAAGIALSVAALAGQVFMGCIQVTQFIITAKNLPETCKYLNLRLRMEQQRLFAWSETSGLLDLQSLNQPAKVQNSNTFVIHRTTILDLLVQIQCLFKEFEKAQANNGLLQVTPELPGSEDEAVVDPADDASSAHVPLSDTRRSFIIKAMKAVKSSTKDNLSEGKRRLRWASFDKNAFEELLQRFSTLNDNMTGILDARLQTEIHRTTQDTNRGVLQLHKDLASLHRLVQALDIKMQNRTSPMATVPQYESANDASGLRLLAQLAKFKAFNESLDTPENSKSKPWDEATAMALQLSNPSKERANMKISREAISLHSSSSAASHIRCEATYQPPTGERQKVWIEWKEYDFPPSKPPSPSPEIISRVSKLASLLHHTPKPSAFRVPHCLGYFDNARQHSSPPNSPGSTEDEDESLDARIGFVFSRPDDDDILPEAKPISLHELLSTRKMPAVTARIQVAHAIANCLLYLHSVNWLHKGIRSQNIVFFPVQRDTPSGKRVQEIDYSRPVLSGFDFARPARDEITEIPGDTGVFNFYRHPMTQWMGYGPRESFRKTFDVYSLGVVMVELAYWKTVDSVLGIDEKMKNTKEVRGLLLKEERREEVAARMGGMFEEAAWRCVEGGQELGLGEGEEDELSDKGAARLSLGFYEGVVKKLGDVRV